MTITHCVEYRIRFENQTVCNIHFYRSCEKPKHKKIKIVILYTKSKM